MVVVVFFFLTLLIGLPIVGIAQGVARTQSRSTVAMPAEYREYLDHLKAERLRN